ncbi:amino acid/amide ABC transporter ATP-binding protein 2 (HAAT family) [Advenella incenata]|jgi:urea transport system ATP-binding protein|uniref:Amino acid/amide ABC transporter ATP-binding protein 2 (HAAT family) n=1 Tax=Advenella incenata TaxID=267800 RepID=A0A4Q7VVJ8_9BURK|nr:urea ABC transporter ATP-binding subunit UrtE [Advenella incenata]RZU00448.1 amino acid/amide ABC transporter ATP-binding protein 2 (HAAT family) [Advenella incenata]
MQLSVQNVNQYYGGSHILRDISFEIEANALTALLGRNGAGKTTLLRSLLGVVPIRDGQINYAGKDISRMGTASRIAQGIGYVPQGRDIFPRLSVKENLLVGAATRKMPKGIPAFIYQLFPVLKEMEHRNGGDLSGGQQQQLAIARALMSEPRLLILDEPTEGIQPNIIQHIGRTLKILVEDHGMTVLLVEQYLDFVKLIADDYLVMNRGVIIAQGKGINIVTDGIERHISV